MPIWLHTVPFDAEMVRRASNLKVIGTPSTGTDHLDLETYIPPIYTVLIFLKAGSNSQFYSNFRAGICASMNVVEELSLLVKHNDQETEYDDLLDFSFRKNIWCPQLGRLGKSI